MGVCLFLLFFSFLWPLLMGWSIGCDTARTTDGSIQTSRWGKQLKGDKSSSSSRPCIICPASLVLYADRFDVDYNGVDAQHRGGGGGVRMPEPVVRPCLYTNK